MDQSTIGFIPADGIVSTGLKIEFNMTASPPPVSTGSAFSPLGASDAERDAFDATETRGTLVVGEPFEGLFDYLYEADEFRLFYGPEEEFLTNFEYKTLVARALSVSLADGTASGREAQSHDAGQSFVGIAAKEMFPPVLVGAGPFAGSLAMSVGQTIAPPYTDLSNPLFTGLATGLELDGTANAGGGRTITYNFAGILGEFANVFGVQFQSDRSFTGYEKTRMTAALDVIESYVDIDFVETTGDGDITFFAARTGGFFSNGVFQSDGELAFSFLPQGDDLEGNVVINTDAFGWDRSSSSGGDFDGGIEQFGFGFLTILHEVGHALGLDHPFESGFSTLFPGLVDSDGDGVADDVFGDAGSFNLNESVYTIMSYVPGWSDHPFGTASVFLDDAIFGRSAELGGHAGTPMALDVAALQQIYGANQGFAAGADVYQLPDTQTQSTGYQLIWDTGGTDEIRYDGARDVVIDLRAATLNVEDGGGGFVSFVNEPSASDPVVGGFTIAHGVVIENAIGGVGNDVLGGNEADNWLDGHGGADVLLGEGGHDTLDAGSGADTVFGGDGSDILLGGSEGDILDGGTENDTLDGGGDDDTLTGGQGADVFLVGPDAGNDTITDFTAGTDVIDIQSLVLSFQQLTVTQSAGGALVAYSAPTGAGSLLLEGIDGTILTASDFVISPDAVNTLIEGTAGSDDLLGTALDEVILGADGDDTLRGAGGADSLFGGNDNDILDGGFGADIMDGGDGDDLYLIDTVNDRIVEAISGGVDIVQSFVSIDLANPNGVYANVENATLAGSGSNSVQGTTDDNVLTGNAGANLLSGRGGHDILFGGAGGDTLEGGDGDDTLNGGAGGDTIDGGIGQDAIDFTGSSSAISLSGGVFNGGDAAGDVISAIEIVIGSDHNDFLTGGIDRDTFFGGAGDDTLNGGAGDDVLTGGTGNDRYFVDSLGDVITELSGGGTADLVTTSISLILPSEVERGSSQGGASLDITGNALANFITGNEASNLLSGLGGADRLIAGGGDDTLAGGSGNDILEGGTGANVFLFSEGDGDDQVRGFQLDVDMLDFSGLGLRFVDLAITSSGNETLITYDLAGADPASVRLVDIDPLAITTGIMTDPHGANSPSGLVPVTLGSTGNDNLAATNGDDDLIGLAGNDFLNGRAGADTLVGGFGDDRYFLDQAGDLVIEQEFQGKDQVDATFSFTLGDHIENGAVLGGVAAIDITGNALGNFITGSSGSNVLIGHGGRDRLIGFGGDDTLIGGSDNDVLEGGEGRDTFVIEADGLIDLITDFELGIDVIDITATGLAFADMVFADGPQGALVIFDLTPGSIDLVTLSGVSSDQLRLANFITIFGENQPPIVGTQNGDNLFGTIEDDELQGLGGNDRIDGQGGADRMLGGLGDDRYFVDDISDIVIELAGEGRDQISTSVTLVLDANIEDANLLGTDDLDLTGNDDTNALIGNTGANSLRGLAGADNLQGFAGADTLDGGAGDDFLRGGADGDTFVFRLSDGNDRIIDFELGLDIIDLSATGLIFAELTITQSGSNALVAYGGDRIIVENVTELDLDESNFAFGLA